MHRLDKFSSHVGYRRYCHLERYNDVAILVLHYKLFNSLTANMRAAIYHYFCEAQRDSTVRCIIITGEMGVFSCGVNIRDFKESALQTNEGGGFIPSLATLTNMVEECNKVVIAAINGLAFSGGLELALAAHYRVALPLAEFLFSEVQLGIVPCGGGTQRLPRLVGVPAAFRMICTSQKVYANETLIMGLVDHIADGRTEKTYFNISIGDITRSKGGGGTQFTLETNIAVVAAIRLSDGWKQPRRLSRDNSKLGNPLYNKALFCWLEREIRLKTPKKVQAPMRCLKAIQAATTESSFTAGLMMEMKLFMQAVSSPEAQAMQHLLRASTATFCSDSGSPSRRVCDGPTVRRIAVIGCGTIGLGVTILALYAGLPLILVEMNEQMCHEAFATVRAEIDRNVKEGHLSSEARERYLANMTVVSYESDISHVIKDVDMVIECIGEDLSLKKQVFSRLSAVCSPHCCLATSASSLGIDELATATQRPEKMVGMHFIPPCNVIPFLEVVQGMSTDQQTLLRAIYIGRLFHKAVIVTKDIGPCLTTRLLFAALFQAFAMLEQGLFPMEVDRALRRFGFRLGVFALEDLAGLDFTARIRVALLKHEKSSFFKIDVCTIPRLLVKEGRLGEKVGRGWYSYEKESFFDSMLRRVIRGADEQGVPVWGVWRKGGASLRKTPHPDRAVELLILDVCRKKGFMRRDISEKEIVERIIFAVINEAAKLLAEGAVSTSAAIDVAMAFAYGFPAWKGGICYYADKIGLSEVVRRMRIYNCAFGDAIFPLPCDKLVEMASKGETFGSLW